MFWVFNSCADLRQNGVSGLLGAVELTAQSCVILHVAMKLPQWAHFERGRFKPQRSPPGKEHLFPCLGVALIA